MNRASSSRNSTWAHRGTVHGGVKASHWRRVAVPVAVGALTLAGCGGGDDSADTTTTTTLPVATTTTLQLVTTTTLPPVATTTPVTAPELVTEGAIVVVANSSGINGAAGRLTDRLAIAGFSTGAATNGTEGQLNVTKIYYDPSNTNAQAVAESVRLALGDGDIQLFEMGVPAPVESGDVGDATVVVSMGNDVADKSLEELQGVAAIESTPTTSAPADG